MKKGISYSELDQGVDRQSYDVVGRVSAESVRKHTGKDWEEWVAILSKAGAGAWTYQKLSQHLKVKHKLTPWWQNGVAMGFEIATGKRKAGQDVKGKYMTTATKSVAAPVSAIWKALVSEEGQKLWLKPLSQLELKPGAQFETEDGYFGEVRTIQKGRRARLFWQDPAWEKHTVVELLVVPRPGKKAIFVVNHTGLADAKTKAKLAPRWRKVADGVPGLLGLD